jgi:hypothetical protein
MRQWNFQDDQHFASPVGRTICGWVWSFSRWKINIREASDAHQNISDHWLTLVSRLVPQIMQLSTFLKTLRIMNMVIYSISQQCICFWKFSRFSHNQILSGNLPVVQLRNKMIEQFKVLFKSFSAVETFYLFSKDLC